MFTSLKLKILIFSWYALGNFILRVKDTNQFVSFVFKSKFTFIQI